MGFNNLRTYLNSPKAAGVHSIYRAAMPAQASTLTYYDILALPNPSSIKDPPTSEAVKTAYRRALLQHHPDKTRETDFTMNTRPSIDQITLAYKTLASSVGRLAYDRSLLLDRPVQQRLISDAGSQDQQCEGFENVDLDDMHVDEMAGLYFLGCHCGRARGYVVTEDELEKHATQGAVNVGCEGCSLWIKVEFGVVDGEAVDEDLRHDKHG